jgi:hypothetical protein
MSVKAYYSEYKRVKRFGLFKLQEIMVIELLLEILAELRHSNAHKYPPVPKKPDLFPIVKNKQKLNKIRHKYK